MHLINLQCSDGEIFKVDRDIIKVSGTIDTLIEHMGLQEGDEEIIPLPAIKGCILKKVIVWATHHKDEPPPEDYDGSYEKQTDDISRWDKDFIKVDQGIFNELMIAATQLDIKGLKELICKTMANIIKGKTPEQIRDAFNIQNDFTAAQEEQMREDYDWIK